MLGISIDLLALVDAEIVKNNGVPGVFIPIEYNGNLVERNGRLSLYTSFSLHRSKSKRYDYKGFQVVPEECKDAILETAKRPAYCIWGFVPHEKNVVGESDFNAIVNEKEASE